MKKFSILVGLILLINLIALAHQVGNIDTNNQPGEHWAWGDVLGWLDFHFSHTAGDDNVFVSGDGLRGWANSSVGIVALNCATTPNGDICSGSNFKVNQSPSASGDLAGWAWNENVGWISFCGNVSGGSTWDGSKWVCPPSPTYQVKIRPSGGQSYFGGSGVQSWAWNDVVGWVSFDCDNPGTSGCGVGGSYYKIQTSAGGQAATAALESSVLDTSGGQTTFNSFTWQGSLNGGTVQFELATSNIESPPSWTYSIVTPTPIAGQPRKLSGSQYVNRRYIRYKITLNSDVWQSASPRIDDIIINWSP